MSLPVQAPLPPAPNPAPANAFPATGNGSPMANESERSESSFRRSLDQARAKSDSAKREQSRERDDAKSSGPASAPPRKTDADASSSPSASRESKSDENTDARSQRDPEQPSDRITDPNPGRPEDRKADHESDPASGHKSDCPSGNPSEANAHPDNTQVTVDGSPTSGDRAAATTAAMAMVAIQNLQNANAPGSNGPNPVATPQGQALGPLNAASGSLLNANAAATTGATTGTNSETNPDFVGLAKAAAQAMADRNAALEKGAGPAPNGDNQPSPSPKPSSTGDAGKNQPSIGDPPNFDFPQSAQVKADVSGNAKPVTNPSPIPAAASGISPALALSQDVRNGLFLNSLNRREGMNAKDPLALNGKDSAPDLETQSISALAGAHAGNPQDASQNQNSETPWNATGFLTGAQGLHGDALQTGPSPFEATAQAPEPPRVTLPLLPAALVQQMLAKANGVAVAGAHEIIMQLEPENLGRVQVAMEMHHGQVAAHIGVESENVRQLMEAQLGNLRQTLEQQGLRVGNLDVTVQDKNSSLLNPDGQNANSFFQHRQALTEGQSGSGFAADSGEETATVETGRRWGYNTVEYLA